MLGVAERIYSCSSNYNHGMYRPPVAPLRVLPRALRTTLTLACLVALQAAAQDSKPAGSGYLSPIIAELEKTWPANRVVNVVVHGHSVPAGYFKTPEVRSLEAYPHLLRVELARRYPRAVVNVIVTAKGGEDSVKGAARFETDVLDHRPDVVLIDYSLNDRRIGLDAARGAWTEMVRKALAHGVKVILLTPTPDMSARFGDPADPLELHAEQVRRVAAEFQVGLVDSTAAFHRATDAAGLKEWMAQVNHPNAAGHKLVAEEIFKYF